MLCLKMRLKIKREVWRAKGGRDFGQMTGSASRALGVSVVVRAYSGVKGVWGEQEDDLHMLPPAGEGDGEKLDVLE